MLSAQQPEGYPIHYRLELKFTDKLFNSGGEREWDFHSRISYAFRSMNSGFFLFSFLSFLGKIAFELNTIVQYTQYAWARSIGHFELFTVECECMSIVDVDVEQF